MVNRDYDGEDLQHDMGIAEKAERILLDVVDSELGLDYDVRYTAQERVWRKRGDVAIMGYNGKDIGLDAKDDGVCYRTGNIFVEEIIDRGYCLEDGWIKAKYDVLAVVSQQHSKIYFIDFARLKAEYKKLRHALNVPSKFKNHTCWGSLVKIDKLRSEGLLLAEITYIGSEQEGFRANSIVVQ